MALGFLSDISSGLGQLSPLAGGIGSLLSAFGVGKPKINYAPTPSEAHANSLLLALSQPNNSLVNYETDQGMKTGMNDLLMALKQRQMLAQRLQSRGVRAGGFNPERADESVDYALSRALPTMRTNAEATAKSNILNRAEALSGIGKQEAARRTLQQTDRNNAFSQFQTSGGFGGMAQQGISGIQNLLMALQGRTPVQQTNGSFPWQSAGNVNPAGGFY
jgi:hypothetical protein